MWPRVKALPRDAGIIKADASRQRGVSAAEEVNWSGAPLSTRAVREYLEALDDESMGFREKPKKPQMAIPCRGSSLRLFDMAYFS